MSDRFKWHTFILDCPKPVIGAAFGGSIGGAIDLLSACDIRYASSDAWFTIKEVDVGLGKMIISRKLPEFLKS